MVLCRRCRGRERELEGGPVHGEVDWWWSWWCNIIRCLIHIIYLIMLPKFYLEPIFKIQNIFLNANK